MSRPWGNPGPLCCQSHSRYKEQFIAPMTDRPLTDRPLAKLDLERAIALRWAMRDIIANRIKLTPLKPDDLHTLVELGLVEVRDGVPVVTERGLQARE